MSKKAQLLTVDEQSKWMGDVLKLGDASKNTVGFMPEQGFYDYARKGHIAGLIVEDELVAYVMFRFKKEAIIIVQLCVADQYRGQGFAKQLIDMLMAREKDYISHMRLSCRRDYNLENFWYTLGFTPVDERPGRATKQTTVLTTWVRVNPECHNLFAAKADTQTVKIPVVLDTNIVIDLCNNVECEAASLNQSFLSNYVEFYITNDVWTEINQSNDTNSRQLHREFISQRFLLAEKFDSELYFEVMRVLNERKKVTKYSNTWFDMSHIAHAISFNAEAFVTNDAEWLNTPISEWIFDQYGLHILSPGEFVKSIDEIASPTDYSPIKLIGLGLEYREMQSSDYPSVVETFYKKYGDQRKSTFKRALRGWMAQPQKYNILIVRKKDIVINLSVYTAEDDVEKVVVFLINEKGISPSIQDSFVKRIAFMLLDKANKTNMQYIVVDKACVPFDMIDTMRECGYLDNGTELVRVLSKKILCPEDLEKPTGLIDSNPLSIAIKRYVDSAKRGEIVAAKATIELEKALWPLKISTSTVPCYIVPIKAEYAKQLFDEDLSNTHISLFDNEKAEPALSIENVYFKSCSHSIGNFPARILWYVSQSDYIGTGAVRASSYLDWVEVGDRRDLYKKYKRLGVLDWHELQTVGGKKSRIAAYGFSYTEQFDKPVYLDAVRKILDRQNEPFQSFREISSLQYLKIYQQGIQGEDNA